MQGVLDLPGPAALVDLDRLERNIRRTREKANRSGVRLRPHVKTHKSVEIARLQFDGDTGPVTVSTLEEAERFAEAGFRDITYAVPLNPALLNRAAALSARIDRLNLLLDHPDLLEGCPAPWRSVRSVFSSKSIAATTGPAWTRSRKRRLTWPNAWLHPPPWSSPGS